MRFLLVAAGALLVTAVVLGVPIHGQTLMLLGLATAAGAFGDRIGAVVSFASSAAGLGFVWLVFDELVRARSLSEAGIGILVALLGALTGAATAAATMLQRRPAVYRSHSPR